MSEASGIERRRFVRDIGLAGAAVAAGCAPATRGGERRVRRPNLVFLLADDMRWDAMGCAGHPLVRTPCLDRLAADGVRFTNAFVTTSICAPNRACILAGQHTRTVGIKDFAQPFSQEQLDRTYPVLLRQAGYRTGFIGKWGVGAGSEELLKLPASRFDYWRGFTRQGKYFHDVDGQRLHLTTGLVPRQVREFLAGCTAEQPFCLSISFKAPHGPWQDFDPALKSLYTGRDLPTLPKTFAKEHFEALPELLRNSLNGLNRRAHDSRWGRREDPEQPAKMVAQYYRLITGLDVAVGKLRAALAERGFDRKTVIVFTSDNGHFLFEQGLMGKWLMYEPSIRVPLLVYDPRLPASARGTTRDEMVLTIDVAPTLLAMAGVPIPRAMQGRDLGPLLAGRRVAWRQDWFYEHTFTLAPPRTIAKSQGVRTERWKYIRYLDPEPHYEQLFDLAADPDELTNLAGDPQHRAILDQLRARYQHYRTALPDNNPEPREYGRPAAPRPRPAASGKRRFRLAQGRVLARGRSPNVVGRSVTIRATIEPNGGGGVIVSQGGRGNGYALYLDDGRLAMATRHGGRLTRLVAPGPLPKGKVAVAGRLGSDGRLSLEVAGKQVASGKAPGPLTVMPGDALEAGGDHHTSVGDYEVPNRFAGRIRDAVVTIGD